MGHRDIWGKDPKKWQKWCPCFDAESEYAEIGKVVHVQDPVLMSEPIVHVDTSTAVPAEEPAEEIIEPVKDNKKSFFSIIVNLFSKLIRK